MQGTYRLPLYAVIMEDIKARISDGTYHPDDRLPSEKELMASYGVSRIVAVNALTNLVKEGLIYRVPGRGSFVSGKTIPEQLPKARPATQMETGKTLGLLIPHIDDPFVIQLVNRLNQEANQRGYYFPLFITSQNPEYEKNSISFLQQQAQGMILFPCNADTYNDAILSMVVQKYPFVLVDRRLPGLEANYVGTDNGLGAKIAFEYLFSLGHHNVALCCTTPLSTYSTGKRLEGYLEALKSSSDLLNPSLVVHNLFERESQEVFREMLRNRKATAAICLDIRDFEICRKIAAELDLDIPRDLSVITFDNPNFHDWSLNTATHIRQNEEEIAKAAIELLLRQIQADFSLCEVIEIPPKLEIGYTTAKCIRK